MTPRAEVILGDSLRVLAGMPDDSVHCIVSDPPYEISMMGRSWDSSGVAFSVDLWAEALRVTRPGGHALIFGATRTWHRLACALEDAGWELRDQIAWMYGSGFPKSLDVSKAVDKAVGADGSWRQEDHPGRKGSRAYAGGTFGQSDSSNAENPEGLRHLYVPGSPEAAQWAGWGTALKPAWEPILVARKPMRSTVARNVLAHGTGGLNIDACRIATDEALGRVNHTTSTFNAKNSTPVVDNSRGLGRWPANVVLGHTEACHDTCTPGCPVAELDRQSGISTKPSKGVRGRGGTTYAGGDGFANSLAEVGQEIGYGDVGGASRFFPAFSYVAKAPARERPVGPDGTRHATVKPLTLMRWLVRLACPEGGTVLDPFAGSGTTLEAAYLEGADSVGVELTPEHVPLIELRLARAAAGGSPPCDPSRLAPPAPVPVPVLGVVAPLRTGTSTTVDNPDSLHQPALFDVDEDAA